MRTGSVIPALLGGALLLATVAGAVPQPLKIGAKPENFTLNTPTGQAVALFTAEKPSATVVLFIATQCPVSNAYNERMAQLAQEYQAKGIRFVAVNSNKQETLDEVGRHAKANGFAFPVVKDPNNVIADRWGALVTPEAFVLDAQGALVYHGRVDDSQQAGNVKSRDLKAALDAVLAGRRPENAETRAFGCTIKRVN
jgi:peroxiredoxin